jgi:hypothetical protein
MGPGPEPFGVLLFVVEALQRWDSREELNCHRLKVPFVSKLREEADRHAFFLFRSLIYLLCGV